MRLTTRILIDIAFSGSVAVLVILGWLMSAEHQRYNTAIERSASAMQRILESQLVGLTQSAGLGPIFPYWYPVTQVAYPDGACARLLNAERVVIRSACRGPTETEAHPPRWFEKLYTLFYSPRDSVTRAIKGSESAHLELKPDGLTEVVTAWSAVTAPAVPATVLITVLCLTVWFSVRREVRPAGEIMRGLAAIERGSLDTRIGPYAAIEFNDIAARSNALAESLSHSHEASRALSRRLIKVQEQERFALARELHDEFGQHLTAISANAAALRSGLGNELATEDTRRIEKSANHLMQLVQDNLVRLRPWAAGDADLAGSLRALADDHLKLRRTSPAIEFKLSGDYDDLPTVISGAAYRITQEALTNALRHAKASEIVITVARHANALTIEVCDDGIGCEPNALDHGFGILGIRDRAAAFGGTVSIFSNPMGGLTVSVEFPNAFAEVAVL